MVHSQKEVEKNIFQREKKMLYQGIPTCCGQWVQEVLWASAVWSHPFHGRGAALGLPVS